MSREIFLEGMLVGRRQVRKYLGAIYHASSPEAIGSIAGKALDELSEKGDFTAHHPCGKTESWRDGFFEGFIDRCEDLKRK